MDPSFGSGHGDGDGDDPRPVSGSGSGSVSGSFHNFVWSDLPTDDLDLSPSQYENVRSTLPTDGNYSSDG